jgi:tetratricopeptide (TPR) repeat protein
MRLSLHAPLTLTIALSLVIATTITAAVRRSAEPPPPSIPTSIGSVSQATNRENEVAMLITRGEKLNIQGSYNEAVKEFQKALEIDAHNSRALFRMGEAAFKLGDIQGTLNVLRKALTEDLRPEWIEVWAHLNIGKILDLRGQRQRAVEAYQKAVDTDNNAYGAQVEAKKYLKEPFLGTNLFWPAP